MRLRLSFLLILITLSAFINCEYSRHDTTPSARAFNANNTSIVQNDINNLLHRIVKYYENTHDTDVSASRTFILKKKLKHLTYGVKRSFKKIFHAWAFYAPEIGLCKCVVHYAWLSHPAFSDFTYRLLGGSKGVVRGFYNDFAHGFHAGKQEQHHGEHHEIADTNTQYGYPYQRIDKDVAAPEPDFIVENNEFKKYVKRTGMRTTGADLDAAKLQIALNTLAMIQLKNDSSKSEVKAEARALSPAQKLGFEIYGYNKNNHFSNIVNLPPPDYTYYEKGTFHHIHDLRHSKPVADVSPKWLSDSNRDFENAIVSVMGLGPPGVVAKASIKKCGINYIIGALLRLFYKKFF